MDAAAINNGDIIIESYTDDGFNCNTVCDLDDFVDDVRVSVQDFSFMYVARFGEDVTRDQIREHADELVVELHYPLGVVNSDTELARTLNLIPNLNGYCRVFGFSDTLWVVRNRNFSRTVEQLDADVRELLELTVNTVADAVRDLWVDNNGQGDDASSEAMPDFFFGPVIPTVDPDWGRFTRLKKQWFVAVPQKFEAGDVVVIHKKTSGQLIRVRLVEEVPFSTSRSDGERRWSFDEVGRDDVSLASKRDDLAEDGYPQWWSRDEAGDVLWPRVNDVWRERGGTREGLVVRSQTSYTKIGWYHPDRSARGEWMNIHEFMDRFEFASCA